MFMSLAQQPRKEEKQERQIYYCKFPKSKIEWLNKLETRAANSLFHIGAHSSMGSKQFEQAMIPNDRVNT